MKTKNQAVVKDVRMWSFKKKDLTITLWGLNRETFLFTGRIFPNITALSIEGYLCKEKKKQYIHTQKENERGIIRIL